MGFFVSPLKPTSPSCRYHPPSFVCRRLETEQGLLADSRDPGVRLFRGGASWDRGLHIFIQVVPHTPLWLPDAQVPPAPTHSRVSLTSFQAVLRSVLNRKTVTKLPEISVEYVSLHRGDMPTFSRHHWVSRKLTLGRTELAWALAVSQGSLLLRSEPQEFLHTHLM